MTTTATLPDEIDLDRYGALIEILVGAPVFLTLRPKDDGQAEACGGACPSRSGAGAVHVADGVLTADGGVWRLEARVAGDFGTMDLTAALDHVSGMLAEEIDRVRELDDMADELGRRYEELNLVYHIDESLHGADESRSLDLARLLRDSLGHLDVLAVALHVPREEQSFLEIESRAGVCSRDIERWWEAMRDSIQTEVSGWSGTLAVNEPEAADTGVALKFVAAPVVTTTGADVGLLAVLRDVGSKNFTTSDRKIIEVLADRAGVMVAQHRDALTGLLNRAGFEQRWAASRTTSTGEGPDILVQVDIDQLKLVNDTCGRGAGDEMLRHVSELLPVHLPQGTLIARLESDEFVVLLRETRLAEATRMVDELIARVRVERLYWEGRPVQVSASAGMVVLGGPDRPTSDLLAMADGACLIAKRRGRDRLHVHDESDPDQVREATQVQWVPRLRRACQEDRFVLYAQPIVPIASDSRAASHVELLLRFIDEAGELCLPGPVIAAAERYEMMPMLDRWVVEHALELARDPHFPACGINLSGQSISDDRFHEFLFDQVDNSAVDAAKLTFEITETAAVANFRAATRLMESLRRRGCRISLDDFGSGLSSFHYLKTMPVDTVKIDGAFVREMDTDPISEVMVSSIYRVARVMGISTVAEFVESEAIIDRLRTIGVDYAQGFGVGRPVSIEQYMAGPMRVAAG